MMVNHTCSALMCPPYTVSDKHTLQNWTLSRSIFSVRPQPSSGPQSLPCCYSVLIEIFSFRRQDNGLYSGARNSSGGELASGTRVLTKHNGFPVKCVGCFFPQIQAMLFFSLHKELLPKEKKKEKEKVWRKCFFLPILY